MFAIIIFLALARAAATHVAARAIEPWLAAVLPFSPTTCGFVAILLMAITIELAAIVIEKAMRR